MSEHSQCSMQQQQLVLLASMAPGCWAEQRCDKTRRDEIRPVTSLHHFSQPG